MSAGQQMMDAARSSGPPRLTRTPVQTSTFTDTVGTFPGTDFTDLNAFDGQVRVQAAGFSHNGFGNVADARAKGTYTAGIGTYGKIHVTGMTGAGDALDQIGVTLCAGTGVRGAAGVSAYRFRINDAAVQTLKAYKCTTDTEVQMGSTINSAFANGDDLSVEVTGSSTLTFHIYQNNTLVGTFSDATSPFTITNNPGLCNMSSADVVRGSLFEAGTLS